MEMNTEEYSLSPQESLALITEAIRNTKNHFRDFSFCFLLWGWLIGLASFGYFVLHTYTRFAYYFLPFPVLVLAGILITLGWYFRRRTKTSQSYFGYFLVRLWAVLGLCFLAVVFINVSRHMQPFTYTLLIEGIGTLVTGLVIKFRPLLIGGLIFLGSSIASIYLPSETQVLLHGIAIFAGYLIPGYMLRSSKE